jgi:hypothetical protein
MGSHATTAQYERTRGPSIDSQRRDGIRIGRINRRLTQQVVSRIFTRDKPTLNAATIAISAVVAVEEAHCCPAVDKSFHPRYPDWVVVVGVELRAAELAAVGAARKADLLCLP